MYRGDKDRHEKGDRLRDDGRDEGRKRLPDDLKEPDLKRPKIEGEERLTGLINKVGDREDQVLNHLTGLTEALLKDLQLHYTHIINQILKSVFTLHHKIGVYSTLTGLLAKRCGEHFTKDSEFPKGAELGKRIVKLTVEMLDRNLVDSVWWKTLVLIQYASQLVHTKVLHPQNMWNILREIVDEVLSINNSSNRRDAYCYMVLEALLIVGHEMHLFHMEMASSGRKTVDRSDEGEAADGGPPHRQHKPVDFVALFDDVSYYMRNRTNRDTDESTLGMTWKKIQEWHKDDWKECQVALHGKPYMAQASAQHRPEMRERFPTPLTAPVLTLKKMRARGAALDRRQPGADDPNQSIDDEDTLNMYVSRIAECKKRGDVDDAYRMWSEVKQKRLKPSLTAYLAILSVCASNGDTKRAQEFWEQMATDGLQPTTTAYNGLLNVYARHGDKELFVKFDEMKASGVAPDINTFNILCASCKQMDCPEKAAELLTEMKACSVEPDAQFFVLVLRNCKAGGNVTLCAQLWTQLTRDYGLEPDKNAYRALEQVFQSAAKGNREEFLLRPTPPPPKPPKLPEAPPIAENGKAAAHATEDTAPAKEEEEEERKAKEVAPSAPMEEDPEVPAGAKPGAAEVKEEEPKAEAEASAEVKTEVKEEVKAEGKAEAVAEAVPEPSVPPPSTEPVPESSP